ncbi:hypothetical protein B5S29_g1934 [[Candida] boidinii]|nr:hypothetical protein B5S29_g1934 [[Candida] boidinii]
MFDSGLFSYLPNIKDKLNSLSTESLITENFPTQQHSQSTVSSPHIIDKLLDIFQNLTSSTPITTPIIPPPVSQNTLQKYFPILNSFVNSIYKNFKYYYKKLILKYLKSFKKISIFSKISISLLLLLSVYILIPTIFKNSKMFSSSNSKRPDKYTTGLINMTTDCFANSTLQSLASLNGLNEYLNKLIKFHSIISIIISSAPTDTDKNIESQKLLTSTFPSLSLHYGLIDILSKLQETIYTSRVISVWDFLHILEKIYNSRISRNQHDAHELLQLILETLEKEHLSLKLFILKNSKFLLNYRIQSVSQSNSSSSSESLFINFNKLVESLPIFPFSSELESYFKCLKCGGVSSKNYNPMTILSLAVPQESYISLDSLFKRNESELIDDYSCLKCKLKFILNQLLNSENKNQDLIITLKNLINDQNVLINDDLSNIISNNNTNNENYDSKLLYEIENFQIDPSNKKLMKSTINKKTCLITPPKILTVHLSRSIYLSSQALRNSCQVEFNGNLELVIDEIIRKDYKSHVYGKEIEFINDINNKNNSNKKNLELIRQTRTFQDDDMNNSHSNFNNKSESVTDTNSAQIDNITDSSKISLTLDSTADADDESIKKLTAELESKVKINTGKSLAFQEKPEDEFVDDSSNNKLMKSLNNSGDDDDDEEVDYKSSDEENDLDEDDEDCDSKSPPLKNIVPPDEDDDVDSDDEQDYDNIKLEVKNSSSNSSPESETTKSKSTVDTIDSQETNQTSLLSAIQNIPKTLEATPQQQQQQSQPKELKKYNYKLRAVVRHQGSHQLGHYECYRRKPIYYKNISNNEYYRKQIELIDPKLVRSQVMIQMNNGTLNSSNINDPINLSETDLENSKRKPIIETNNSEQNNSNTNAITSGSDTEHHQGLRINTHFDSTSHDLQNSLSPTTAVISDISEKSEWKLNSSNNNPTEDSAADASNNNNVSSTEIKRKSSISDRIRSRVSSLVGGSRPRMSSISDASTTGSPPTGISPLSELHPQSGNNSNPSFNSQSPPSFSLRRKSRSGSTSHRRSSITSPQAGVRKPVHSSHDKKLGSSVKHPFWRISDSKITEYTGLDVFADSKAVYMLFFEREG